MGSIDGYVFTTYVTVSLAVAAAALSQGFLHYLTFISTNLHLQLNIIYSRDYVIFYYDNT